MTTAGTAHRSPTVALLLGLLLSLAVVVVYTWYITGQINGLRRLQSELTDRNRRESLQLLRIQDDLNQLGLSMQDMLDSTGPYPVSARSAQFERIRTDLDDALKQQEAGAIAVSGAVGGAVLGRGGPHVCAGTRWARGRGA
jgi:hypothetical protein